MTEIVNLNQFRKNKRRAEEKRVAANNRLEFGRTKAERETAAAEKAAKEKDLDGKKAHPGPVDDDS